MVTKIESLKYQTQILWGINLFLVFVYFVHKRGLLSQTQKEHIQKELRSLKEDVEKKPIEELVKSLNTYIEETNQLHKKNTRDFTYAPFPSFSIASGSSEKSAVLDHLDMVERTLTEAAKANTIGWHEEGSLFSEILQVFTKVENKKLFPKDGMALLVIEIKKINELLPDECKLPVPDLSVYET